MVPNRGSKLTWDKFSIILFLIIICSIHTFGNVQVTAGAPPSPIPGPAIYPTFSPIKSPSASPTRNPSTRPTAQPTPTPSCGPSRYPTLAPIGTTSTAIPSRYPTKQPTFKPSSQQYSKSGSTSLTAGEIIGIILAVLAAVVIGVYLLRDNITHPFQGRKKVPQDEIAENNGGKVFNPIIGMLNAVISTSCVQVSVISLHDNFSIRTYHSIVFFSSFFHTFI